MTGAKEPIATAVLRAVQRSLESLPDDDVRQEVVSHVRRLANAPGGPSDADVVKAVEMAAQHICLSGLGTGLLLILDELGKFLEYAAQHPERQDVYFLQTLAEAAARSGRHTILVVGLLHQGFNAYAEQLTQVAQKEWEKVAGRFDEVLFNQPLEQMTGLIADALQVQTDQLPKAVSAQATGDMKAAIKLGWYGSSAGDDLASLAPRLYPLHPTVIPILPRLFARFGQNERSLFGYLCSDEPFGLRAFAARPLRQAGFYRLHDLYDYARINFGHRLAVQSYRSHWNQVESVVESFPKVDIDRVNLLKAVAVLNLLDDPDLRASDDSLLLAVAPSRPRDDLSEAIQELRRKTRVLYHRGAAGGYCLWPHTSVNLDRAYQAAVRAVGVPSPIAPHLRADLETRPLVARRHYIETGNLRHFIVRYGAADELEALIEDDHRRADGIILVALCETEPDRRKAMAFSRSASACARPDLLVAVSSPLAALAGLVHELHRWHWVAANTPDLNHDSYAAEEVARQLAAAREALDRRLRSYVGLRQFDQATELRWYRHGKPLAISGGRELLSTLSTICDEVYPDAPRVLNELVNRDSLSSAAAAARMRLIERIFKHGGEPLLGMDTKSAPPEMSMYLSVLREANLHHVANDEWAVGLPDGLADRCRVRPVFARMLEILEGRNEGRVSVSELFASLRRPPFGVRDGLAPLLFAAFAAAHEHDVAFFEEGAFLRTVGGLEFQRLLKDPGRFEIQYCRMGGIRAAVLDKVFRLLKPGEVRPAKSDILDVVRQLCEFAASLPAYTHRTGSLSPYASAVREVILQAEEPATLLFTQLPTACGVGRLGTDAAPKAELIEQFVKRLKTALDELRTAYPALIERVKSEVLSALARPGRFGEARASAAATARKLLIAVSDTRLKAYCLRLADDRLAEREWLEGLASFVLSKPPSKWRDADVRSFGEELERLAAHYRRVESAAFSAKGDPVEAVRLAVTRTDGREVERVIYVGPEEEKRARALEADFLKLLRAEDRVGLVAATRALWHCLDGPAKAVDSEPE
ncbi:MAG: hypothetical protein BGO49_26140 [Planctomycetales bacterium 71-10]|nr:MAG: hypothetical protein BGO49_26140 [Planctomycetales bacterium 71-10]